MKKLLIMAGIMGVTAQAHAQGSSEFSHSAEFRARYQFDQNINNIANDPQNSQDAFEHRFKLDTTFRASEQFSAHLSLIHNAVWGSTNQGAANSTGNTGVAINDGIGNAENMVLVQEAYGHWMVNDSVSLKGGRMTYQIADGSVIGINDWQQTPYSFDGGVVSYEMEHVKVDAIGFRLAEWDQTITGGDRTNQDPENNLFGLSIDIKTMPEWLKMINLHVLQNNAGDVRAIAGTDTPDSRGFGAAGKLNLLRYGVAIGGDAMNIDYKVNYNAHNGKIEVAGTPNTELNGDMFQIELGYTLPEVMNSRFYVLYHQSSGADEQGKGGYDPFLYELHHNAGRMDIFQWGNLSYFQFGYHLMPTDTLKVGIDYIMFSRTEKTDDVNLGRLGSRLGRASSGLTARNGATNLRDLSDRLGDEIDLIAEKSYDNGLTIVGRAGMFMPGDFFKATSAAGTTVVADKTYTQFFLEARMNF